MKEVSSRKTDENALDYEKWRNELISRHRWGRMKFWFGIDDDKTSEELTRLRGSWETAKPLSPSSRKVMDQIIRLEVCNWRLEDSILALCKAIGEGEPVKTGIGHIASMTEERWKRIWAYYFSLRNWLPNEIGNGYELPLKNCDPDGSIQIRISDMLGERSELKALYVERLCLCLGFWLGGYYPKESAQRIAHDQAVRSLEERIGKRDLEGQILAAFKHEGDGKLNPCHHKLFRRYDIIISSIGSGLWRGAIPKDGSEGFGRAEILERYLSPIQSWIDTSHESVTDSEGKGTELTEKIHAFLGKPDNKKVFLAYLLLSLLRSQQQAARKLAQSRSIQ